MTVNVDNSIDMELIPVTDLRGVGPQLAEKLERMGITVIADVLFHLPMRYQDRTRTIPIGSLRFGEEVVIEGEILATDVHFGKRRSLVCKIQDGTGITTLRFFHFSNSQKQNLSKGKRVRCYGEVRRGSFGLELYHPEYRSLDQNKPLPLEDHLTPVYPLTEGLHQQRMRSLVNLVLDLLQQGGVLKVLLPEKKVMSLEKITMPVAISSLQDALLYLHHPPKDAPLDQLLEGKHPAQKSLAFEELLAHHLSLQKLRKKTKSKEAPILKKNKKILKQFKDRLLFQLTSAQDRVFEEIAVDIGQNHPMLRLVQGDVGSGKTVVAALAALLTVGNGYQTAIMAPTEILAEQHFLNFSNWLEPLGISLAWLTSRVKGKQRQQALYRIEAHEASIVIGTHALFQDEVNFAKLGLVIVDEQHRFGVHQRLALKQKGVIGNRHPHQLTMTATPIPRTLAMSLYADMDCSVIDELPPGRKPVDTAVISDQRRGEVIGRVHEACAQGRQAYWVCTLIEESEVLQCQAAENITTDLQQQLPDLSIGLVHGRMKDQEKAKVMNLFKEGKIQLLVATTVIEVGVDVANASLMIIENSERLGLAQLHQLRGRVGRGALESYCLLMYQSPLSQFGKQRLGIMRETNDGFVIAEKDLEIRGPGEVLGTRQTGLMQMKIADLQKDADLLAIIHQYAPELMASYPENVDPLIRRWLRSGDEYGNV